MPFGFDDALLVLSALATAAGTATTIAGAHEAQQQMQSAASAETARQRRMQRDASSTFNQSLQESTPFKGQQQVDAGASQAMANYQRLNALPLSAGNAPFGQTANARVATDAQNQQQNAAGARLQGYSPWQLQQAIKNLRAQQQLGIIGQNAQQSASLLPLELTSAQHAGDTLAGVGSLIRAGGGLAGAYASQLPQQSSSLYAGSTNAPWNAQAWRY